MKDKRDAGVFKELETAVQVKPLYIATNKVFDFLFLLLPGIVYSAKPASA
jgi:hypothetical protein